MSFLLLAFLRYEQIISAQQLPLPKNSRGEEIVEKSAMDPFVQVYIYIPDWTHVPFISSSNDDPPSLTSAGEARTVSSQTKAVKSNGFNPVWQETLSLEFDCVGDMSELVFVHFVVRQAGGTEDEPLAMYCTPLRCLESGMYILWKYSIQ
jgi:phosphatidylinositol phospholipase C delta